MPSRSLQRLPPRSPLRSLDRGTPRWPRRLAGRAGSRHRHPLPDRQDNKTGHTAKTRAVCQVPEDKMTENHGGCLVPFHITLGAGRGGSNAAGCRVIEDSCRTCPYPPQTLELLAPVSPRPIPAGRSTRGPSPRSGRAAAMV